MKDIKFPMKDITETASPWPLTELEKDTQMFETSTQKGVGQTLLAVPIPSTTKKLKTALWGQIKRPLTPVSGAW